MDLHWSDGMVQAGWGGGTGWGMGGGWLEKEKENLLWNDD